MISLYARLAAIASLLVALAGAGWWCYSQGKKTVTAEWTAEKLASSENARLREQAAQKSNERADRDYQIKKASDRAVAAAASDSLRQLTTAIATPSAATGPQCGADDPRPTIASECAAALTEMDQYGRGLASQVAALQGYAREVCLAK